MSALTEFLLARIAEDEALANSAGPYGRPLGGHWVSRRPGQPECHVYGDFGWVVEGPDVETHDSEWGKAVADHIARHDPARVLAECEAKRRIVETHAIQVDKDVKRGRYNETTKEFETCDNGYCFECDHDRDYGHIGSPDGLNGCPTLRLVALPYADHPDYRDEWKP